MLWPPAAAAFQPVTERFNRDPRASDPYCHPQARRTAQAPGNHPLLRVRTIKRFKTFSSTRPIARTRTRARIEQKHREEPEKGSAAAAAAAAAAASGTTTSAATRSRGQHAHHVNRSPRLCSFGFRRTSFLLGKSDLNQESNLEATIASMESRIVANISIASTSVPQGIVGQLTALQNRRDSDFMDSQAGLLNMVADVLQQEYRVRAQGDHHQQFQAITPGSSLSPSTGQFPITLLASEPGRSEIAPTPLPRASEARAGERNIDQVAHGLNAQIDAHVTRL